MSTGKIQFIYLTEVYNDCIEIPVTIEKQYLREQ